MSKHLIHNKIIVDNATALHRNDNNKNNNNRTHAHTHIRNNIFARVKINSFCSAAVIKQSKNIEIPLRDYCQLNWNIKLNHQKYMRRASRACWTADTGERNNHEGWKKKKQAFSIYWLMLFLLLFCCWFWLLFCSQLISKELNMHTKSDFRKWMEQKNEEQQQTDTNSHVIYIESNRKCGWIVSAFFSRVAACRKWKKLLLTAIYLPWKWGLVA